MNKTIADIMERRSIRSFTGEKISKEALVLIAEAGKAAPSGRNNQLRMFSVVQDPALIDAARVALGDRYFNFYGANVLIFVAAADSNRYAVEDSACAIENMMVAAQSLGLGSVWINQFKDACGDMKVREYLRRIKIPDDYSVCCVLALGVPAPGSAAKADKQNKIEYIL